jgi:hypothetical protein
MVALSPALILTAFVNWDLLAMALTAGGVAAWAARSEVLAGVLLGLGVAAKFYPLIVFGALLLLCLRAGRMREFGKAAAAGAFAWLAVNLPIALNAPAGWAHFFAFSRSRGADWGSIWFMFEYFNLRGVGDSSIGMLNVMSSACFAVAAVAIAVLALAAPRRPRLPQQCFLLLAAFLMLNKVWSPQYVVWLVPFAVLARPRIWAYVAWQLAEVAYFFAIWGYFVHLYTTGEQAGLGPGWYFAAVIARFLTVALLAAIVVQDILHPERDRVRASGLLDDPAGGVLDEAPDRRVLRLRRAVPVLAHSLAQPADVGGDPGLRRLADHRGAGRPHHVQECRGVDRSRVEVRVPVRARPELITRVVAVHQVNPAGDRLDPVHHVRQVDARRIGVAGVQAESDLATVACRGADRFPQPRDGVEGPGHRAGAARGVFDEHRQRPLDPLDRLGPVLQALGGVHPGVDVPAVHDQPFRPDRGGRLELLIEQLAGRDPDPVVGRGHVDDVRRVDVHVHVGLRVRVAHRGRVPAGDHRPLPALRVAEEELSEPSLARDCFAQWIVAVEMTSDAQHS